MSFPAVLRCAAIPATVTLLLGGALAAPVPATAEPPAPPAATSPDTLKPAARARPNLSGKWRLDPKASDDPARVAGGGQGPGRGGGTGDGTGGRGRGGAGRGPEADPNLGRAPGEGFDSSEGPANEKAEAAGRQAAREVGELEIFHDGDEFDLTDGMQISRMLRIDGQPTDVFTPHGVMKATAAWENDALVVTEMDPRGQVRRSHHFLLGAGGNTLTVRQIRHHPGQKTEVDALTLVYRREDDSQKP